MPHNVAEPLRPLGRTGILVSPVALGCWPIAGVSSLGVNDADSIATIRAALDAGVNFLDTAYCYGRRGESETLIRRALDGVRDRVVVATKGGIHYNVAGQQEQDARPKTIARECDESLSRLGADRVELYYLHAPDPNVPLAESAGAVRRLVDAGKVRAAGVSNVTLRELKEFHAVCPLAAAQLPYNMLQRDIEVETIPWCVANGVSVTAYWPLMKGLLAGRLDPDQPLDPCDSRRNYPMYQGDEWKRNQVFVAELRRIAVDAGRTVAQLVVNWTIHRTGITAALCGAKRAWQIDETAAAMGWRLSAERAAALEAAIVVRGQAEVKRLFR
jgi:aryl-alcohol dehydrogenase-like predicted oxidoreductase